MYLLHFLSYIRWMSNFHPYVLWRINVGHPHASQNSFDYGIHWCCFFAWCRKYCFIVLICTLLAYKGDASKICTKLPRTSRHSLVHLTLACAIRVSIHSVTRTPMLKAIFDLKARLDAFQEIFQIPRERNTLFTVTIVQLIIFSSPIFSAVMDAAQAH